MEKLNIFLFLSNILFENNNGKEINNGIKYLPCTPVIALPPTSPNTSTVQYKYIAVYIPTTPRIKDKILFVIPAYNETENIEKVLNEIKKDAPFADILVINDCSKDNTKEIVENNNVKCINNIFNMRYAMAVQTGIKYASSYSYDYVIQFDADGQHIASEAIKLYKEAKKDNCDIVIGSR